MIIYTQKVNWGKVKTFVGRPAELVKAVELLVPKWALCVPNIVDNQKYYVALYLRKALSIQYTPRTELVKALTDGIHLSGLITGFVALDEMLAVVDKEQLAMALMEGI